MALQKSQGDIIIIDEAMAEEEIYQRCNMAFYSDTYIFKQLELDGAIITVYVKINCRNKIEEMGTDVASRMHCEGLSFDELKKLKYAEKATELQKSILNSIDYEYWCHVRRVEKEFDRRDLYRHYFGQFILQPGYRPHTWVVIDLYQDIAVYFDEHDYYGSQQIKTLWGEIIKDNEIYAKANGEVHDWLYHTHKEIL